MTEKEETTTKEITELKTEKEFGIQIENETVIPEFVIEQNTASTLLWHWQIRAIDFFEQSRGKAIFECATGTGKTKLGIELIKRILEEHPDYFVLIVVPKNVILETGWYKELYEAGVSLKDIGAYYGAVKEYSKITITNMQSLDKVAVEQFQVVIWDEAHHMATNRVMKYVTLPHWKYIIGLSATIERNDRKHMSLMKTFNYNVFHYSPKQALAEGILNPFVFYNIGIVMDDDTETKYNFLTEEINQCILAGGGFGKIMFGSTGLKYKLLKLMSQRKALVNNYYKKFDVVNKICVKHKEDKIIVFNEYNAQTNKYYWELLDSGVKACIFHSSLPKKLKEQNLIDFKKGKYRCILASKALDEGWNIPSLDVAILCAGDSTSRQTIQRMGRVLRKKAKHSYLYQVYVANTIEETQSLERAKMFKDLSSNYHECTINNAGELKID